MRGGFRPGAGRPRGIKELRPRRPKQKRAAIGNQKKPDQGPAEKLDPLAYMLKVMNDPKAETERRDRMAIASAPFVHARKGVGLGKKEEKNEKAKVAGTGRFSPAKPPFRIVK